MFSSIKFRLFAVLASVFALSGCISEVAEVPTAYRGMISTGNGLKEGVLPPSKIRLTNICRVCDSLVLAEVSDYGVTEAFDIYMPKDRLNLTVEVRGTLSTSTEDKDIAMIFNRISPEKVTNRVSVVRAQRVYETYAQQIVREKARAILAKYDIATVMSNRESISAELYAAVAEGLQNRPVKVLNFGLNDAQPPQVVLTAELNRKSREIAIMQAEAQKEVSLTEAQAALEVAALQQAVELKEAETQVMVEQKLREGFSDAYVAQRGLRILETLANSDNNIVFLPTEALSNPAMMIGAMNESFTQRTATRAAAPAEPAASDAETDTNAPAETLDRVEIPQQSPEEILQQIAPEAAR